MLPDLAVGRVGEPEAILVEHGEACDEGDERCRSVREIEAEFGILFAKSEILAPEVENDEAKSEEAATYLAVAIPEASDDPVQTRRFIASFQRDQSKTNPNVRVTGTPTRRRSPPCARNSATGREDSARRSGAWSSLGSQSEAR